MPKGTKVHKLYEKLKAEGYSVSSAIKIAQARTGMALATGKPSKARMKERGKRRVGKRKSKGSNSSGSPYSQQLKRSYAQG